MTNLAQNFTGLLFYAYVGIHQVRKLVFDNYQTCTFPLNQDKHLENIPKTLFHSIQRASTKHPQIWSGMPQSSEENLGRKPWSHFICSHTACNNIKRVGCSHSAMSALCDPFPHWAFTKQPLQLLHELHSYIEVYKKKHMTDRSCQAETMVSQTPLDWSLITTGKEETRVVFVSFS